MSSLIQSILNLPTVQLFEIFIFSILLVIVVATIATLGKTTQMNQKDIRQLYLMVDSKRKDLYKIAPKKKE